MHWLELHIDTNHTGLDPVTALLSSLDIDNVMIDDEEEFHAFLEENRPHWDYVDEDLEREMRGKSRITFYLLAGDTGFAKLAEVRVALQALKESRSDCGSLLLTLEEVQDADWETSWKQYYKPLEIGERLLVIPQWETAELHGRVPLILDPGLTFGTGSHATTRLCLTALEQAVQGGEQDNGHPGLAADKLAHPKAVQLGQHHVQQDQVERLLLKEAHRLNAVPRRCRLIARVAQVGLQQLLDVLLVLHNQNAFHCESLPKQMVAHNCEFCMEKVSRAAARKYRCPPFLLRGMIRPLPAFQA